MGCFNPTLLLYPIRWVLECILRKCGAVIYMLNVVLKHVHRSSRVRGKFASVITGTEAVNTIINDRPLLSASEGPQLAQDLVCQQRARARTDHAFLY